MVGVRKIRALSACVVLTAACGGAAAPSSSNETVARPAATVAATAAPAASGSQGGYDEYGYGYRAATPSGPLTGDMKLVTSAKAGKILAASNGLTVYTYKLDKANTPTCVDMCSATWPPVTVASGNPTAPAGFSGALTLVSRPDGSKQVALNGMPLYLFSGDKSEGDANGNGVDGIWTAVKAP